MIGIVAFSFARHLINEPNPCNVRLAAEIERLIKGAEGSALVVSQWEVNLALPLGTAGYSVIEHRSLDEYLDSEEVMSQAAEFFRKHNITRVIVVAQPFLQLAKCRKLARTEGFTVIKKKINKIGFYKDSSQWWTRGPVRLLAYAVLQILFGRRGK